MATSLAAGLSGPHSQQTGSHQQRGEQVAPDEESLTVGLCAWLWGCPVQEMSSDGMCSHCLSPQSGALRSPSRLGRSLPVLLPQRPHACGVPPGASLGSEPRCSLVPSCLSFPAGPLTTGLLLAPLASAPRTCAPGVALQRVLSGFSRVWPPTRAPAPWDWLNCFPKNEGDSRAASTVSELGDGCAAPYEF